MRRRDRRRNEMNDQASALVPAPLRAGWNDAAWGQSPREVSAAQSDAYARGYAGGVIYRQHQPPEIAEPTTSATWTSREGSVSPNRRGQA
jgi:hypothetical protein